MFAGDRLASTLTGTTNRNEIDCFVSAERE